MSLRNHTNGLFRIVGVHGIGMQVSMFREGKISIWNVVNHDSEYALELSTRLSLIDRER